MSDLLTTAEVSVLLHTPQATLRHWRSVGRGPRSFALGGRRVLYKRSDVEAWLQEQYEAGTASAAAG